VSTNRPTSGGGGGRVQSIDRAAAVLRCFVAGGAGSAGADGVSAERGASEVARETGLSISTAHRLLVALASNGLLSRTPSGRYALGPLVARLASGGVRTHLRSAALPLMHRLRDRVAETVGLHELMAGGERAVIDQAESHQPLHRRYTEIGVPIPLSLGAPGKAILAFLAPEHRAVALSQPIPQVTSATITDPRRLDRDLAAARRRGCAFSFEERTLGVHTVAAPLWDHHPAVIGSLSISAPKARMDRSRMDELVEPVVKTARGVSRLLGATDDSVQRAVRSLTGA